MGNFVNLTIKTKDKKHRWQLILIVASLLLIIITIMAILLHTNAQRDTYLTDLKNVQSKIADGGNQANQMCTLTAKVWYNSIHDKSDPNTDAYTRGAKGFNTAIERLYDDLSTKLIMKDLQTNQEEVTSLLEKLKNPSQDMEKYHNVLLEFHKLYGELINLASDPKGSYKEYNENIVRVYNEFHQYQKELTTILPDSMPK